MTPSEIIADFEQGLATRPCDPGYVLTPAGLAVVAVVRFTRALPDIAESSRSHALEALTVQLGTLTHDEDVAALLADLAVPGGR